MKKAQNEGTPFIVLVQRHTLTQLWRVSIANTFQSPILFTQQDMLSESKAYDAGLAWLEGQGWNVQPMRDALKTGKPQQIRLQKLQ